MLQRFNTKIAKNLKLFLPQKMQWWFFLQFCAENKKVYRQNLLFLLSFFRWKKILFERFRINCQSNAFSSVFTFLCFFSADWVSAFDIYLVKLNKIEAEILYWLFYSSNFKQWKFIEYILRDWQVKEIFLKNFRWIIIRFGQ